MKPKKANLDSIIRAISKTTGEYFNGKYDDVTALTMLKGLVFCNELKLKELTLKTKVRKKKEENA